MTAVANAWRNAIRLGYAIGLFEEEVALRLGVQVRWAGLECNGDFVLPVPEGGHPMSAERVHASDHASDDWIPVDWMPVDIVLTARLLAIWRTRYRRARARIAEVSMRGPCTIGTYDARRDVAEYEMLFAEAKAKLFAFLDIASNDWLIQELGEPF